MRSVAVAVALLALLVAPAFAGETLKKGNYRLQPWDGSPYVDASVSSDGTLTCMSRNWQQDDKGNYVVTFTGPNGDPWRYTLDVQTIEYPRTRFYIFTVEVYDDPPGQWRFVDVHLGDVVTI